MKLKRLILTDYQIFKHVDIDFENVKLSSIIGRWKSDSRRSNGSGKSSLIESIRTALFNTQRGKSKEDAIRHGAARYAIDLTVEANGQTLQVQRSRARDGTSQAKIWVNGKLAGDQTRVVDAQVRTYLGIDDELFDLIYFFKQDDQTKFVQSSPSERKNYLGRIFDMSSCDKCQEEAKLRYSNTFNLINQINGSITAYKNQILQTEDDNILREKIEELNDSLYRLENLNDADDTYLQDFYVSEHVFNDLFEQFCLEIEGEIKTLQNVEDAIQNSIHRIVQLKSDLQRAQSINDHNSRIVKQLEPSLALAQAEKVDYGPQISELNLKISVAELAYAEKCVELKNAKSFTVSSIEPGSKCPTCKQEIPHKHFNDLKLQYIEASKKIEQGVKSEKELVDRLKNDLEKIKQLKKNLEDVYENIHRYNDASKSLKESSSLLRSIEKQIDDLELEKKKACEMQAMIVSNSHVSISPSIKASLENIKRGITNIKQYFSNKKSSFTSKKIAISTEINLIESKIDQKKSLIQKVKESEEKLIVLNRQLEAYKILIDVFSKNGIQAIMIENVVGTIEQFANSILKDMHTRFSIKLKTQKQIQSGENRETLDIIVYDNGSERAYESYSGGERTMINLAMRLALSRIVSSQHGIKIQSLFLDEVLASLDEVNREDAIRIIAYLSKSFDQVYVISHVDVIKDIIPSNILITRHEDHSTVEIKNDSIHSSAA